MRIVVDRAKCMGSGNCVLASSDVFAQDDEGLVDVLQPSPPAPLRAQVEAAIRACPAAVISIAEDDAKGSPNTAT